MSRPPEGFSNPSIHVASTSQEGQEGMERSPLLVTLLSGEWRSLIDGDLSTFNRELAIQLAKHPSVQVSVFLPQCSEYDKRIAASHKVQLIEAEKMTGFDPVDWLMNIPQDHAVDCIIGHGVQLGRQIPLIQRSHKCKWIQIVHNAPEALAMYKSNADAIPRGEKMQQTEIELCELADQVVAVGPKLADTYRRLLRSSKKHQDVIDLTPSIFTEFKDVKQATEEGTTFCVLIIGSGDSEDFNLKGYDLAAEAIAELKEKSYQLKFVGALKGKEKEMAEKLLRHGIARSQLEVCSFNETLTKLFCEVDLAIMPSRSEGFGLTALEALSAGLPVLVSSNSGLGEALRKVPNGPNCVVDSDDPKEWASRIKAVREKDRASVRLAESDLLREKYLEKYSWQELCGVLVEKMQNLVTASKLRIDVDSVKSAEQNTQDRTASSKKPGGPQTEEHLAELSLVELKEIAQAEAEKEFKSEIRVLRQEKPETITKVSVATIQLASAPDLGEEKRRIEWRMEKIEQDRLLREQEEKKRREEAERKRKEDEERAKQEEERKRREEEAEKERLKEELKLEKEAEEREREKREEEERKRQEEELWRRMTLEERRKKLEEDRKKREDEERIWRREMEERKKREEEEKRKQVERKRLKRLSIERKKFEEDEKKRLDAIERKRLEDEERERLEDEQRRREELSLAELKLKTTISEEMYDACKEYFEKDTARGNMAMRRNAQNMAIPLCLPNNCQWSAATGQYIKTGERRSSLYVIDEALQNLRTVRGPVCVVSIAGPCRGGKSYILSEAFDQPEVFPLGHQMDPETMGIWMWIVPQKIRDSNGQECTVVLLDSEGIEAAIGEDLDYNQIFTLTVLLASVLIYNSRGFPTRCDLDELDVIVKLSQRIKVRTSNGGGSIRGRQEDTEFFHKTFPVFIWLFRDVTERLPRNCKDVKECILTRVFKNQGSSRVDQNQEVAESILRFFPGFLAAKLPPPTFDREVLFNINRNKSQMIPNFLSGIEKFKELLRATLIPKHSFNDGEIVTGEGLAALVQLYVEAINTPGVIPNVQTAWETFVVTKCSKAANAALKAYDIIMTSRLASQLPCSNEEIRNGHKAALEQGVAQLEAETMGIPVVTTEKYLTELTEAMGKKLASWQGDNERLTRESCTNLLKQLKKEHLDPVLAQLHGEGGAKVMFEDIVAGYSRIEHDYNARATGAKDVFAALFCEFHPELMNEMQQYLGVLRQLKDFDENLSKEIAANVYQKQKIVKLEEEIARLQQENREQQMKLKQMEML